MCFPLAYQAETPPPACPALLFIPSPSIWIWFLLLLLSYLSIPVSIMSYKRVSSKLYVNDTRLNVTLRSICCFPSNLMSLSLRDWSTPKHMARVHCFYFAFVVVEVRVWVSGDEVVGTECAWIPEHTQSVPASISRELAAALLCSTSAFHPSFCLFSARDGAQGVVQACLARGLPLSFMPSPAHLLEA